VLQSKLCDAIRSGNFLETAATYAGVDESTLHRWLKRGRRKRKGSYHDLAVAFDKAVADSEVLGVARITKAANDGSWQASAWLLERRFPENWGRRERREIKADINSTMKVKNYGKQSVEEIMRLLAARDAGGGSPGPAEQPAAGAPRGTPT
jgi:hypothetical protein